MSTETGMLNESMLEQRMMRGALRGGVIEEEGAVAKKYCKGKLDSGRPCRIMLVGGGEYCQRHQKEIDALAAGAPIEPGQVERLTSFGPEPETLVGGGLAEISGGTAAPSTSPLRKLLKPAPVPAPLPSTFIVLDFNQEEFDAIQSEKVTPEDLKQLALWLIAGELCRIPPVDAGMHQLSSEEISRRVGAAA